MEYTLNNGQVINIKEYKTRKISRGYTETLLEGSTIGLNGESSINASNSEKANDYLVREMTGLNQKEVDDLHDDDYKSIFQIINEQESKPRK